MNNVFIDEQEGFEGEFTGQGPYTSESELNVLERTNNPQLETPISFALSEMEPSFIDSAKAHFKNLFVSSAYEAAIGQTRLGTQLVQAGEAQDAFEGGPLDVAKQSYLRRAEQSNGSPIGIAGFLGVEKDVVLSMLTKGDKAPNVLKNVGMDLIDKNQNYLKANNLIPRSDMPITTAIGRAGTSFLSTLGILFTTRNPNLASAYAFAVTDSDSYAELRAGNKQPVEAAAYAGSNAAISAALETIGGRVMLSTMKGFSPFKKFVSKVLFEGMTESAQEGVEGEIMDVAGVRDATAGQRLQDAAFAFAIGATVSGGVQTVALPFRNAAKSEGMSDEQIANVIDKVDENLPKITDMIAEKLSREQAQLANYSPQMEESSRVMREILDAKKVADSVKDSGEVVTDPATAAKSLVFATKDYDVRSQFIELARKRDLMMSEVQALAEKHGLAKTPDVSKIETSIEPELIAGRMSKLSEEIGGVSQKIEDLAGKISSSESAGRSVVRLNDGLRKLIDKKAKLEGEMRNLEKGRWKTKAQVTEGVGKPVSVRAGTIAKRFESQTKKAIREIESQFAKGRVLGRASVIESQNLMAKYINKSGLSKEDKGALISNIQKANDPEKLAESLKQAEEKIKSLTEARTRRELIGKIEKVGKNASKAKTVSADYREKIKTLVDSLDTKKMTDKTAKSLERLMDFLSGNPQVEAPAWIKSKLDRINKTSVANLSTGELADIYQTILSLKEQGKAALQERAAAEEAYVRNALNEIAAGSERIGASSGSLADPGKTLPGMQKMQQRYNTSKEVAQKLNLIKMPTDFAINALDKKGDFSGPNYRIFKQTYDEAYGKYLGSMNKRTDYVVGIIKENEISRPQLEKIGVYGVLKQKDGRKKLLFSGYTENQLENIQLSEQETKVYDAISSVYRDLSSELKTVMKDVHNKTFKVIDGYFPLFTDRSKSSGTESILDSMALYIGATNKKTSKDYFTKQRKGGDQAVIVDALDVFTRYVNDASYLVSTSGTLKRLTEIAESNGYHSSVGAVGSSFMADQIKYWVRNGRDLPGEHPWARNTINFLKNNAAVAVLAAKLSTVAVQFASLVLPSRMLGKYMVTGISSALSDARWRKLVNDAMPEVKYRVGNDPSYDDYMIMQYSPESSDVAEKAALYYKKAKHYGFLPMQMSDKMTAFAVATGAYQKYMNDNGLEVDFDAPNKDAAEYAQFVVRTTLASPFKKDKPLMATGTIGSAAFQFQSYSLNLAALVQQQVVLSAKHKDPKIAAAMFGVLTMSIIAEMLLRHGSEEMIGAITGDNPELTEDKIIKKMLAGYAGTVPFASQLVNSFEYGSYPVPIVSLTQQVQKEVSYAKQAKSGGAAEARHIANATILAAGAFAGLPGAAQMKQIVDKSLKKDKKSGGSRKRKTRNNRSGTRRGED